MSILSGKSTGHRLVMDVENMSLRSNGVLQIQNLATLKYILYSKGKSTENRKHTIFNAFLVIPHTDFISIL